MYSSMELMEFKKSDIFTKIRLRKISNKKVKNVKNINFA